MTIERGDVFAVALPVMLVLSVVAPGALAPAAGEANGIQETETELRLAASGNETVVGGQNVTANFTLTNVGDHSSNAAVVDLVNIPADWEFVNQSAGPNLTYSEVNSAWVSTETLAPGDSLDVSVTLRPPNETAQSVYHVSARAVDAAGNEATAVHRVRLGSAGDGPLSISATAPDSIRPGENVSMTLSLTNEGDSAAVAPVLDLASVPSGWTVLNQSAGANLTYSEVNSAWVSTETLAPGESLEVSVLLGTDREESVGPYFVSVRGFGEGGAQTAEALRVNVSGEPVPAETTTAPGANETTTETTTEAETTSTAETTTEAETTSTAETTTEAETTVERAETTTEESIITTEISETTSGGSETTVVDEATAEDSQTTVGDSETTTAEATTTAGETASANATASATFLVEDGENATVTLEVADDPEERSQGLMFRESLPENHGMVFVYDDPEQRTFWMKNTLIPLDMIFVAPNGTVLNVEHAQVQPDASDEELDRYSSDGEAMYVVELERGFANRTGVGPGTVVEFEGLNATTNETTTAE
jgi:uncharacterized membrane protein (UPF0127 family)